jgi:hypothetical protein
MKYGSIHRGKPGHDVTGERFGRWTVVRRAGTLGRCSTWWCVADGTIEEKIKTKDYLMAERRKALSRARAVTKVQCQST